MNDGIDPAAEQPGHRDSRIRDVVAQLPILVGFLVPFIGGIALAVALGSSGYDAESGAITPVWFNIASLPVLTTPLWVPVVGAAVVSERRGVVAARLLAGAVLGWFAAAAGLASSTGAS